MLHRSHTYVNSLKCTMEMMDEVPDLKVVLTTVKRPASDHAQRFNVPANNEMVSIMVGERFHMGKMVITLRFTMSAAQLENRSVESILLTILCLPVGDERGEKSRESQVGLWSTCTPRSKLNVLLCPTTNFYRKCLRHTSTSNGLIP